MIESSLPTKIFLPHFQTDSWLVSISKSRCLGLGWSRVISGHLGCQEGGSMWCPTTLTGQALPCPACCAEIMHNHGDQDGHYHLPLQHGQQQQGQLWCVDFELADRVIANPATPIWLCWFTMIHVCRVAWLLRQVLQSMEMPFLYVSLCFSPCFFVWAPRECLKMFEAFALKCGDSSMSWGLQCLPRRISRRRSTSRPTLPSQGPAWTLDRQVARYPPMNDLRSKSI